MKICSNCGASNADAAKFCNECATAFVPVESPKSVPVSESASSKVSPTDLAKSLLSRAEEFHKKRRADIMFILDCTGSMQGEIDAIRDAITSFADSIASDGVRARVGLIEFRDRLIDEEHRALLFNGEPFTSDPAAFRSEVSKLAAGGGGDEPESSLDAVMLALQQPFDPDAQKVFVLVTDAPPHIPDKETKSIEEVAQAVRAFGLNQFYLVMQTQSPESLIYLKLLEGVRGMAFELGKGDDFRKRAEDFKKTLMNLGKTISSATR